VIPYGGRIKKIGFNLLRGPGNDLAGITVQEATGCALTIINKGRGTPAGFATPLLRATCNTAIAKPKSRAGGL